MTASSSRPNPPTPSAAHSASHVCQHETPQLRQPHDMGAALRCLASTHTDVARGGAISRVELPRLRLSFTAALEAPAWAGCASAGDLDAASSDCAARNMFMTELARDREDP